MSSFVGCTAACPSGDAHFDLTCARREYPDLEPLLGGLDRYFNAGIRPGHFLSAVLTNDLQGTFGRADGESVTRLPRLLQLLYNHAPALAWGSRDAVAAWPRQVREAGAGVVG